MKSFQSHHSGIFENIRLHKGIYWGYNLTKKKDSAKAVQVKEENMYVGIYDYFSLSLVLDDLLSLLCLDYDLTINNTLF